MQIRHTKLEIDPDEPFKNDELRRKDLEPPLTQFVTQATGSFVLALDASWGSGKTTFLEMWKAKLSQAGHACLYLNAWQNDFAQDPLIAIIGELTEAIKDFAKQSGETESALKEQMEKTRQFAESLLKRLLPLGIKIATHGLLDIKEAAIEKAIADATSSGGEDLIKNYEKGKSEIEKFREAIGDLASQVASLNPSAKVVIIIDELDRCRPTYAIELLERVKHLFDASGVVFILGIDRSQLNHSIRSLYGSEFDATGYLRRFIDLDYRLPEPQVGDYCKYLFENFGINDLMSKRNRNYDDYQLESHLEGLMSAAKMSLREQEQTISRLRIVLQTIPRYAQLYGNILSLLLFLREWNTNIYEDVIEGKIDLDKIIPQIEALPRIKEVSGNFINVGMIEAYFLLIQAELRMFDLTLPRLAIYKSLDQSIMTPEVEKAQQVIATYEKFLSSTNDHRFVHMGFKETVRRIAITNNFVSYEN
ncbi:MAG: hypothetical protein DCE90_10140 [Pseudanabaena sp.]|nr:MAG: hypothetical protein DCE90_10140 [Pseudanabaena sp.]